MSDDDEIPKVGSLMLGPKLGELDGVAVFAANDPRFVSTVAFVTKQGPQAAALFAAGKCETDATNGNGIEVQDFGVGQGCVYLLAKPTDAQLADLLAGKRRLGEP